VLLLLPDGFEGLAVLIADLTCLLGELPESLRQPC
jgi:hypothetical protein